MAEVSSSSSDWIRYMKLGTIKSPSEFPQAAMKVFKDLGNHSFKKTDTPATVLGLLVKGFTNAGINGGPTPGLTDETSKAGHALAINIYGASNDINPNNRDECCEAVIATLGFNFQRKFMEKINALSYHKLKKEDFQQVGGDSGVVDPDKFQTDIDEAFEGENGVFWLGKNKIVEEDILVSALRKLYHQTEIAGIPNRTVVPRMGEKKGSVESFEFAKGETALEKYVALGELFLSYSCSHCKDGEGRASGDIADQTQLTMVRKTLNAIIAKDPDGQKTSTLIAIKNVLLAAHNKVKPNILVAEGLKLVDVFMTGSLQKASRKGLAKTTNGKHLSKLAHAFLKILDGPALSIDINKLSDPAYIKSTSTEVMTRLIAMAEWAEYNSDELDENIETNANIASMFSIAAAIIQPFCVSEETEEPQVSSAKNNSYHAGNYGGESTQQPTLNSETSWTKFGDDSNGHPIYYKTGDSETLQALTQGDYRSLKMCGNGTHCCAVQFAKDGVKSFFSGSCKNGVCVICAGSHSAAYCRDASKVERLNAAKVCMDLKPVFERSVLQAIENQGNGGSPKKQGGGFRGSNSNGQKDSPTKQDKKIAIEKAFKSSIGAGGFSNVPATKKNIGLFRKVMNDTFSPKKHKPEEKEKETSAAVAFKAVRAVKDRSTASFNAVRTVINNPSAAAFKAIRAVTAMFKQQKKGVDGTIDFTKDTALCYLRLITTEGDVGPIIAAMLDEGSQIHGLMNPVFMARAQTTGCLGPVVKKQEINLTNDSNCDMGSISKVYKLKLGIEKFTDDSSTGSPTITINVVLLESDKSEDPHFTLGLPFRKESLLVQVGTSVMVVRGAEGNIGYLPCATEAENSAQISDEKRTELENVKYSKKDVQEMLADKL